MVLRDSTNIFLHSTHNRVGKCNKNIAFIHNLGYNTMLKEWAVRSVMNINVGDVIQMKKSHPCGCNTFTVKRIGMDFKICCNGCGHEVMLPRKAVEKSIKKIITASGENK